LWTVLDPRCPVLPGIDDGSGDIDGSIALPRAVAAGRRLMAATPHVGLQYPIVPGALGGRVAELHEALGRAGVSLEVARGGELGPSGAGHRSDDHLRAIAVEAAPASSSSARSRTPLHDACARCTPAPARLPDPVAHPERSPEFLRDRRELSDLVDGGAYVQVTAASLRADFGRTVRGYSLDFLEAGLLHLVASDAHDASTRGQAAREIWRRSFPTRAVAGSDRAAYGDGSASAVGQRGTAAAGRREVSTTWGTLMLR
jgi:protein-tyrosine phosphatase